MTAETTADETPPPIAATTAARLLSLFIVRRLRPGPAGGPGVRRTSGRPNSRLFSPHSLPGPRNQGASAWDFQFGAEAVDLANNISGLYIPVLGSLGPLSFVSKKEIDN